MFNHRIQWTAAILGVFVLQIFVGAVSGGVAGLISSEKRLAEWQSGEGFIIPGTESATTTPMEPVEVDEEAEVRLVPIAEMESRVRAVPEALRRRKSVVGILYQKTKGGALTENGELGRVVALTSDGWFAIPFLGLESLRPGNVLLQYGQQSYPVERAILDKATGLWFLKVEARNLSSASFAYLAGQHEGTALWMEPDTMQFLTSVLIGMRTDLYRERQGSDTAERRLLIQGWLEAGQIGSPVWDANGSLVGIIEKGDNDRLSAIPAPRIATSLQSVIENDEVRLASLGARGVDLSLVVFTEERSLPERGFQLRADPVKKLPAVSPNSPAEKAGLKEGDVILQIDHDILDGSRDLADIVLQFRPASKVTMRIWREGKEEEVEVTFGEQVTSRIVP